MTQRFRCDMKGQKLTDQNNSELKRALPQNDPSRQPSNDPPSLDALNKAFRCEPHVIDERTERQIQELHLLGKQDLKEYDRAVEDLLEGCSIAERLAISHRLLTLSSRDSK